MSTANPYCEALAIRAPRLEEVKNAREASSYTLLLVALLERGGPMTLAEVAERFEEAGVASAEDALASLKRCRPARAPVYRDADRYALDPHDAEADLWAFRLGLRPPKVTAPLVPPEPAPTPLPSPYERLTVAALDEAWRESVPNAWSAQRIAASVLDAHEEPMRPEDVLAFVQARSERSRLSVDSAQSWHRGAAIAVREDGRWELDREHDALRSARQAVRDRIETLRRWPPRPDPEILKANRERFERERRKSAERLARLRRVLIHAFPQSSPEAVVLVDVSERAIETFLGEEIAEARRRLSSYDLIGAAGVRPLLRALAFDPGERRLAELGPPQKTKQLNRQGRKLNVTLELLVRGSCGISRPFGDPRVLRGYLRDGKLTKLRRRLEADAKSLYALYQYGRLHHGVRLRWGFLDERIPAPWVQRDETSLYDVMTRARELAVPLEVVVGSAPGWADPWSRKRLAYLERGERGWDTVLVREDGFVIDPDDVQLARLTADLSGRK